MHQDEEHLRLLSVFYYVYAGLIALAACASALLFVIGIALLINPQALGPRNDNPDDPSDLTMTIFAACLGLLGAAFATCLIIVGRSLSKRKRYVFCLVIAGLSCMLFPFGTALGICSLIVLARSSVKPLFDRATPLPPVFSK